MFEKHQLPVRTIVEIGCGAGGILDVLSRHPALRESRLSGYDLSPQAITLAQRLENPRVDFHCQDFLAQAGLPVADLLLVIDVFEHVRDYLGFLERCRDKGEYKLYHIPLDVHVSSVARGTFTRERYTVGHLHYFTAESALATLRDTGHEVVDSFYTDGATGLFRQHPSFKTAVANVPRWFISRLSVPWAARLLGGYSLLVLTR
jgi:cyclopropane fatty-acyl-phospholipid synthase-like methyltransferase